MSRDEITAHQLARLNSLLRKILPHNRFYAGQLANIRLPLDSLADLGNLPLTLKDQLIEPNSDDGFSTNLTFPVDQYTRFHRTSGTRGRALTVLDTAADWQWWIDAWQFVLDSAGIRSSDRLLMAFSFGPFIGFWSAFDAAVARGALCIPTGGMSTLARLELIGSTSANVLFCTPSYALHMAEIGLENNIAVSELPIDRIVVAGEPGGSVPEIRRRIESQWQAQVIDHGGASEVGPWGYSDSESCGLVVNESEFIAEFLSREHDGVATDGELAELVITNLGRTGAPVIRYRTGDLVRPAWRDKPRCRFVLLAGGILGRADDMMIIRGVNIFPSSIESILRSFPDVIEYRMTAFRDGQMDQLRIEVEDRLDDSARIADAFQVRLGLRIEVSCLPIGSLPRFELKGKRFLDQRKS